MRLAVTSLAPAVGSLVARRPALRQGQYGPYYPQSKQLHLASGQMRPVYRVKVLRFSDGTTAVQIESEPPFSVADSAAVRREVRTIWSAFAPYVEAQPVEAAVITATNLRRAGIWAVSLDHDHAPLRSNCKAERGSELAHGP